MTRVKSGVAGGDAGPPRSFLLALLRWFGRQARGRAHYAGEHLVEGFFGRHFFFAGAIVAVGVLVVAGAAANHLGVVADHGHDQMILRPLAPRTVIVDFVTETHTSSANENLPQRRGDTEKNKEKARTTPLPRINADQHRSERTTKIRADPRSSA